MASHLTSEKLFIRKAVKSSTVVVGFRFVTWSDLNFTIPSTVDVPFKFPTTKGSQIIFLIFLWVTFFHSLSSFQFSVFSIFSVSSQYFSIFTRLSLTHIWIFILFIYGTYRWYYRLTSRRQGNRWRYLIDRFLLKITCCRTSFLYHVEC